MNIVVIDGQSGRLGSQIAERLLSAGVSDTEITVVGTNALATAAMLKAGVKNAATGENAVLVACRSAELIAGPIGIVIADALLGEITPAMAIAIGQSRAAKVLLPLNRCGNYIVGMENLSRSALIEEAVAQILSLRAQ